MIWLLKSEEHVNEKIKRIAAYVEELKDPLKSLLQDSVQVLTEDYAYWESTIIEVPGHEHEHHDHDDVEHNHNHTSAPDLTPEMILEIQRDLRNRIVKLNIRAQKLLDALEKENTNEPIEVKEKASSYGV